MDAEEETMQGSTRQPYLSRRGAPRRGPRKGGWLFIRALLVATMGVSIISITPVAASGQNNIQTVQMGSGTVGAGGFHVFFAEPTSVTTFNLDFDVSAEWNADLTTSVGWDSDDVRQGADLAVARSVVPFATGTLDVTWTTTGHIAPFNGIFGSIDIGTHTVTKSVGCNPTVGGTSFDCSAESGVFTVIPGAGPTTPYVKLRVNSTFQVIPEQAVVTRDLSIGGLPVAGPDALDLTSAVDIEHLAMPCTAQPGDAVDYALTDYSWSPWVTAHENLGADVGQMDPLTGTIELPAIGTHLGDFDQAASFDLQGDGFVTSMGTLKANNIAPSIDPLGGFSGNEGSPISFSSNVTSNCGISSYVWDFSDGTKSYGPAPKRAFGDNGLYDGQLTVTDITGKTAARSFTVAVSDLAPVVNAGPDTTADWGRAVQFNGQATDPGWIDQATLQYTWVFGDGLPSASAGPSVVHSYATPGTYTADLFVCDKENACAGDSRQIIVTKRDTTLGYTGPLSGSPSKSVTLSATLVDEYGQAVVGRKVTFVLGGQLVMGATDGTGKTSISLRLNQKPGSYPLTVSFMPFGGDVLYMNAADLGRTFVIGK